ncbi:Phosphoenolpyruvate/pyruvate domain-containing protein [Thozetella sp. PMI_491]|nr:Phosphoenolpyruvate/pyruvate domain-containing protein [Thozetella sp. PMI_491]
MPETTAAKPRHLLSDLFKQKQTIIATFVLTKGVRTAQVLAHTGVDAVIVDCEHGNIDDSDMHDMVAAVAGSAVSPVVRIASADGTRIKRALDAGAYGILVPMVSSADEARSVVSWAKFPPIGSRGQGSPFACFELSIPTPAEYVATANEKLVTMVQIETAAAIENIEEICQVDGLDVVMIGPNDLALALLGYMPAKGDEPAYLEAIDKVVNSARKHGKKVGITAVDGQAAKKVKERFDFVVLGADVRVLQAWYARELSVARS